LNIIEEAKMVIIETAEDWDMLYKYIPNATLYSEFGAMRVCTPEHNAIRTIIDGKGNFKFRTGPGQYRTYVDINNEELISIIKMHSL